MSKIITIHAKKEPSLLDIETRFNITDTINEEEEFQVHATDEYNTEVFPEEMNFLFDWEIFRSELEFE